MSQEQKLPGALDAQTNKPHEDHQPQSRLADQKAVGHQHREFWLRSEEEEGFQDLFYQSKKGTSLRRHSLWTIPEEGEDEADEGDNEGVARALEKIDEILAELDPLPDTTSLEPSSFSTEEEYRAAFTAQVDEICAFLPPMDDRFVSRLPPYNFMPHFDALLHWWAPRLKEVSQLGEAALAEFWELFHKVLDLWESVPFSDSNGWGLPVALRREVSLFSSFLSYRG